MIKLRAIGRCLFFLQSCRTSNYVRSVVMSWFQSDVCVMERLRKKILFKLSVRVEVSSVESNETTAATVSCDLAPPPQRRRRRHPPPPPPRNLPFVTFQGSKETFRSMHYRCFSVRVVWLQRAGGQAAVRVEDEHHCRGEPHIDRVVAAQDPASVSKLIVYITLCPPPKKNIHLCIL